MRKVNISVLVSGGGTNFQAVIDAIERGDIPCGQIVQVISSTSRNWFPGNFYRMMEWDNLCRQWRKLFRSFQNISKFNQFISTFFIQSTHNVIWVFSKEGFIYIFNIK